MGIPQQRRSMVLLWGYCSRGEEYGVILERPVDTTADWRGRMLTQGRPVSTANR